MMTFTAQRAALLSATFSGLLALAACGGGGGDGTSPPAAKSWQPAQLLQAGGVVGNISAPALASDAAGNAMVVWTESNGRTRDVWARRYARGAGWGAPQLVENNEGLTRGPQVAFDSAGNALAVWAQLDGGVYRVWGNRHTPSGGWGAAQRIDTNDRGDALEPRIAVDKAGRALVTWEKATGTDTGIWASLYTVAQGWLAASAIGTSTGLPGGAPIGSFDAAGNIHAVWAQTDGTYNRIWAVRYTAAAGWSLPQAIESTQLGDAHEADIAVDGAGNAMAVWNHWDGQHWGLWMNRYSPAQGWGTAQRIAAHSVTDTASPRITFDPAGAAMLVWLQWDGSRYNLRASRHQSATGWTASQLIETDDAGSAYPPRVTHDAAGNAIAVWHQHDGTNTHIWANRYSVATGWGTALRIEANNLSDAGNPALAIDASGNAIAIWRQSEGSRFNLWFAACQ